LSPSREDTPLIRKDWTRHNDLQSITLNTKDWTRHIDLQNTTLNTKGWAKRTPLKIKLDYNVLCWKRLLCNMHISSFSLSRWSHIIVSVPSQVIDIQPHWRPKISPTIRTITSHLKSLSTTKITMVAVEYQLLGLEQTQLCGSILIKKNC
jgi:hypothetical protein